MPSPKKECPQCGGAMAPSASLCRKCKPTYKRTPEHKAAMSAALTGIPKPSLKGRKRPEVACKISAAWTEEMKEAARLRGLANAEDRSWLIAIAEAVSGAKNPRFLGKNQGSLYAPGWGPMYRRRIRSRANGICEWCKRQPESRLDLHHVDFSKTNHDPSNLAVICRSCHKKAHAKHKRSLQA